MRNSTRRPLDLIVFMAVLATGVLLIALGVPASSLATISVALSGLYNAWTGIARTPPSPHHRESSDDGGRSRPVPQPGN
ncbi:hypothetical protein [Streptomyces sp. GS7]|uniref:hypothetical protein n=1 Tax=Streptomyces sp. GS7 TaxID=2692234 RepID=UPI0013199C7B|nr:hypothetical protein [Streptomyces sp. GS7]QHC23328.1 hypothetical protein GR130_19950 [Streptomyces sp. GS7]